jgi:ribosome-associated translation inhibitor RaiA
MVRPGAAPSARDNARKSLTAIVASVLLPIFSGIQRSGGSATMTLEITGIRIGIALRRRVARLMTEALEEWHGAPVTAHVTFFDDNGPKNAPGIRCALTVRAPRRRAVHVEAVDVEPRRAFDAAYDKLARRLHEEQKRMRDLRRRPKKYFVATRLLTTAVAS